MSIWTLKTVKALRRFSPESRNCLHHELELCGWSFCGMVSMVSVVSVVLFQEFPKFVGKRDTMKFPDRFSLCFTAFQHLHCDALRNVACT